MTNGDDLMQKADALMRRRAGEAEAPDEKGFEAFAGEADIPVLTEVVDGPSPKEGEPAGTGVSERLNNALASELEAWLDEQLPQHVMRVLDGITDQLINQVSLKAKSELLPRLQAAADAAAKAEGPAAPRDEA